MKRTNLLALFCICCATWGWIGISSALAATTGDSDSAAKQASTQPVDANGKPLNFDFESGTLEGWKVEGEAFVRQPIKGDTIAARRNDMKSGHQGAYWIGTYELGGDRVEGTLTSEPFEVTKRWASFLVGGGVEENDTYVEIVATDRDRPVARSGGRNDEEMFRVTVDLQDYLGKKVFVRVVDHASGGWGHINFDDFRLSADKPDGAQMISKGIKAAPKPDNYKYDGLSPEDAAKAMTVPDNFKVTLFAGEPDVYQPVAMCIDDRGRVWIAEAYVYPQRKRLPDGKESPGPFVPAGEQGDRIVIFEDTDGDGKHDKRTVFLENLNMVSGLEVGFGGVWIGAAPYFMFVPMQAGEDKPAGEPKILLDGWGYGDTHETLNAFIWGPDGWLYGCHGVFTHSEVGKPGTPKSARTRLNCGIWRYHPTQHKFEVFAHGTSNPWGLDFNDWGQAFEEACVIPHLFQMIQNARYLRQGGEHFNPYTYEDIQTIADHLHYVGANPHGGNNRSDSAGGGHAHCGTMIYLGGAWPDEYRNQMFMGNIHGRRINMDILKQRGSGYVASHGADFLLANDAWARFINLRYGPDGNVYLIDWYDKQACHRNEPEIWDRSNGRIYKISYRGTKPATDVDISKKSNDELVALQLNENDWYVRHARRNLQERFAGKTLKPADRDAIRGGLEKIAFTNSDETRRLRGLWALQVTGGLTEAQVLKAMGDSAPYLRAWAIQLDLEKNHKPSQKILEKLVSLAKDDPSQIVRLYLSSAAQFIPTEQRWDLVEGLLSHEEDASDHNLPCMDWYAAEPLAAVDAGRALDLAIKSKVPMVEFMTRRIVAMNKPNLMAMLAQRLASSSDAKVQLEMLEGMTIALRGRRKVAEPKSWGDAFQKLQASSNQAIRDRALALSVVFGSQDAFKLLRERLADSKQPAEQRAAALASLLQARDAELPGVMQNLLADPGLRSPALRGLANYDDAKTPAAILGVYDKLDSSEKREAIGTLASRVPYAKALIAAVAQKQVPVSDLTADVVRQISGYDDQAMNEQIKKLWGTVRETAADRKEAMQQYRKMLAQKKDLPKDPSHGRMLFAKTCAQCHTLFGVGAKIGPDITGSNRANLDYLLENVLDPSAVVPKEYRMTTFNVGGRVINGIVKQENANVIVVQEPTQLTTIEVGDLDGPRVESTQSMMPEGQLKPMSDDDVRALIAYLQSPEQVPMEATPETAKNFFNGKDLTGWDGDPKLWSVEDGEIVGRSPGLKHNEFLKSHLTAKDFRLKAKVKLTPNKENSGIQFRSEALPKGEMKGYQADIGKGWWGKLYEENGRALLWKESGEKHVKENDWNDYEVVAEGSHIKTYINGQLCVDYNDPPGARQGIFAFQLHSGGPLEVRYKDLQLEILSPQ